MDALYCNCCKSKYDTIDYMPKILPCLAIRCLRCLKNEQYSQEEYLIKCTNCLKVHFIRNVNSLPTSDIVLHLIKSSTDQNHEHITAGAQSGLNPRLEYFESDKLKLKEFVENLKENMRDESFEIYSHYANIINDIDIRAEQLLQFVHLSRENLQNKVKDIRDNSLAIFNEDKSIKEHDKETKNIVALKDEIFSIDERKVKNPEDLNRFINFSNKLQQFINIMKKNLWYFSENPIKFEDSVLGQILSVKFDRNFITIKNLSTILSDKKSVNKVNLDQQFNRLIVRQEVLVLNQIVKIYLSETSSLHLQVFDLDGKLQKSLKAFEGN